MFVNAFSLVDNGKDLYLTRPSNESAVIRYNAVSNKMKCLNKLQVQYDVERSQNAGEILVTFMCCFFSSNITYVTMRTNLKWIEISIPRQIQICFANIGIAKHSISKHTNYIPIVFTLHYGRSTKIMSFLQYCQLLRGRNRITYRIIAAWQSNSSKIVR